MDDRHRDTEARQFRQIQPEAFPSYIAGTTQIMKDCTIICSRNAPLYMLIACQGSLCSMSQVQHTSHFVWRLLPQLPYRQPQSRLCRPSDRLLSNHQPCLHRRHRLTLEKSPSMDKHVKPFFKSWDTWMHGQQMHGQLLISAQNV